MPKTALSADAAGAIALRFAREGWLLRFATICVNQFGSRAWRKTNVRPILGGIAGFEGGPDHASRHKLVETARTAAFGRGSGRAQFGNDAPVRRDGDALARFDSTDVATEVVFQVANAS